MGEEVILKTDAGTILAVGVLFGFVLGWLGAAIVWRGKGRRDG